jgi:hypothetical protein
MADVSAALQIYARAAEYVRAAGLDQEIAWQRQTNLEKLTEPTFLREAAWVILCSGFRETVVRRVFDHISLCFCDWDSAAAIVESYPACYLAARASFRNAPKLAAIVELARRIEAAGFAALKAAILSDPIGTLRKFRFIGPVTVWHLAKNIGYDAAKPDRHLVRVSKRLGFRGPHQFCAAIAKVNGEAVKVIDLIVWRFLADNAGREGFGRGAWAEDGNTMLSGKTNWNLATSPG